MSRATLLLPAAARFGKQGLNEVAARALGRADRIKHEGDGQRAQLLRHFNLVPNHWPIAALTRQADAGDAALSAWLRADPAYVQPDINGARLRACGDMLALTEADSAALLPALKPLFGDVGFPIDAPTPSHWYLRVPRESKLPAFTEPGDALGDDLFEHLAEGVDGRRWRVLLSEAQVVLHNHPRNAQRIAQGKMPVNSLWFWGGGVLPDAVQTSHNAVYSSEETMCALANAAKETQSSSRRTPGPSFDIRPSQPGPGVRRDDGLEIAQGLSIGFRSLPSQYPGTSGDVLFDLRAERDLARLQHDWLQPALLAMQRGELRVLHIDFADGAVFEIERSQRWRFWRKLMTCFNP